MLLSLLGTDYVQAALRVAGLELGAVARFRVERRDVDLVAYLLLHGEVVYYLVAGVPGVLHEFAALLLSKLLSNFYNYRFIHIICTIVIIIQIKICY